MTTETCPASKGGSRSRKKARLGLARLHRHIENRREDFQWKVANDLVSRYDLLCFEDIDIKAVQMIWGRKIGDLAFASFLDKVGYLVAKHGKRVVKKGRWEPSSKACSRCGYKESDAARYEAMDVPGMRDHP